MKALVTGGAQRIGRAIALYLAGRGFDVAVHYANSTEAAAETVAKLRALGVAAVALQGDLLDQEKTASLVPRAVAALGGPLTLLVGRVSRIRI